MNIRLARLEDIPAISRLYEGLFALTAHLQPEFWQTAEQDETFLVSFIGNNESDIFVAEIENEIIGFALVQEQETLPHNSIVPHRFAYFMDVMVKSEYRNKGIGTRFIEKVKEWAKERKLDYIELHVVAENTQAIKLYERNGYKHAMHLMRVKL